MTPSSDTPRGAARIYPSLVRPVHIGGVERNAAGALTILNAWLLFGFRLNWLSLATVLFTVLVLLPLLRRATAKDPRFLAVYRAHVLRAGIYRGQPPHTHPHSRSTPTL